MLKPSTSTSSVCPIILYSLCFLKCEELFRLASDGCEATWWGLKREVKIRDKSRCCEGFNSDPLFRDCSFKLKRWLPHKIRFLFLEQVWIKTCDLCWVQIISLFIMDLPGYYQAYEILYSIPLFFVTAVYVISHTLTKRLYYKRSLRVTPTDKINIICLLCFYSFSRLCSNASNLISSNHRIITWVLNHYSFKILLNIYYWLIEKISNKLYFDTFLFNIGLSLLRR